MNKKLLEKLCNDDMDRAEAIQRAYAAGYIARERAHKIEQLKDGLEDLRETLNKVNIKKEKI